MMREFTSVESLLSAVRSELKSTIHNMHPVMDHIGEEVAHTAKDKLGLYNPAIGPFPAWAPLAESTKQQRSQAGFTENEPLLRDGALRDAIQHEAHADHVIIGVRSGPTSDGKADIGDIGYWQEMGTASIPPRPFLQPALYQNQEHIVKLIGDHVVKKLKG